MIALTGHENAKRRSVDDEHGENHLPDIVPPVNEDNNVLVQPDYKEKSRIMGGNEPVESSRSDKLSVIAKLGLSPSSPPPKSDEYSTGPGQCIF